MGEGEGKPRIERCIQHAERLAALETSTKAAVDSIPRIHDRLDAVAGMPAAVDQIQVSMTSLEDRERHTAIKVARLAVEVALAGAIAFLLFKQMMVEPASAAPPAPSSSTSTGRTP